MFTTVNEPEVWAVIDTARLDLSNYLHSLSLLQWDEQSLCEGWKVRDVVAHLILEYRYKPSQDYGEFIQSGFQINRFLKNTAVNLGRSPVHDLLQRYDSLLHDHRKPKSIPLPNILVDLLVHEQDIRIPLGQPRPMPLAWLDLIFTHWRADTFNIGEKLMGVPKRIKDIVFIATDIDFLSGTGKRVEGQAEDILLALVGRKQGLDRLTGEGVITLKSRLNENRSG